MSAASAAASMETEMPNCASAAPSAGTIFGPTCDQVIPDRENMYAAPACPLSPKAPTTPVAPLALSDTEYPNSPSPTPPEGVIFAPAGPRSCRSA